MEGIEGSSERTVSFVKTLKEAIRSLLCDAGPLHLVILRLIKGCIIGEEEQAILRSPEYKERKKQAFTCVGNHLERFVKSFHLQFTPVAGNINEDFHSSFVDVLLLHYESKEVHLHGDILKRANGRYISSCIEAVSILVGGHEIMSQCIVADLVPYSAGCDDGRNLQLQNKVKNHGGAVDVSAFKVMKQCRLFELALCDVRNVAVFGAKPREAFKDSVLSIVKTGHSAGCYHPSNFTRPLLITFLKSRTPLQQVQIREDLREVAILIGGNSQYENADRFMNLVEPDESLRLLKLQGNAMGGTAGGPNDFRVVGATKDLDRAVAGGDVHEIFLATSAL